MNESDRALRSWDWLAPRGIGYALLYRFARCLPNREINIALLVGLTTSCSLLNFEINTGFVRGVFLFCWLTGVCVNKKRPEDKVRPGASMF